MRTGVADAERRAWGSRPATTTETDGRTCSSRTRGARGTRCTVGTASDSGPADGVRRCQRRLRDAAALTGWGDSWVDLDLDTDLDLVLTNGDIPVANLGEDAEPIQMLENRCDRDGGFGSRIWGCRAAGERPAADERTRSRGGRLRQRWGRGCRGQLDRRFADPAREHIDWGQLAGGVAAGIRGRALGSQRCCLTGAGWCDMSWPEGVTSRRRIPASCSGLGDAVEVRRLVDPLSRRHRARLAHVEVNQLVELNEPRR